ncbi:hypothetical protein M9435_005948 [Picochlorum sp. BPE23]|nr:hypothetical protein M9435_005948 [Picochlorum sp. BPE23]WPT17653.1 hypothetical protein PSENEW3_00005655 [Picochlorum sp. SENEW3]
MALNPNVYMPPAMAYATRERDRPKPAPVPYLGEYFFASRDTCHVSISGGGDDRFKHSGKGRVFLTNYRMIYLPDKPQGEFRGIELPLLFIQDFDVCQPILGANYLHGHCRRVDDPMGSPMLKWKLRFINGGMGTMVPLFYSTVAYIRTASQRQGGESHQQAPVVDEQKVDEMYKPPPFVANAVVDPNDPTIVYIVEQPPVPQEEPAVEPKFPTAKKND